MRPSDIEVKKEILDLCNRDKDPCSKSYEQEALRLIHHYYKVPLTTCREILDSILEEKPDATEEALSGGIDGATMLCLRRLGRSKSTPLEPTPTLLIDACKAIHSGYDTLIRAGITPRGMFLSYLEWLGFLEEDPQTGEPRDLDMQALEQKVAMLASQNKITLRVQELL